MTTTFFDRFLTRGSGSVAFRLSIAGFPYEAVTHASMAGVAGDGRTRLVGLNVDGVKLSQKANLVMATVEASGATFKFVDVNEAWTAAFNTAPAATTWLNQAELTAAGGTMTVLSTEAFPMSGYLYIDQETMSYEVLDDSTFTLTTRGRWDSLAAYHYVHTGGRARNPEVTSSPTVLEGRRCTLHMYVDGDSPTGDGTQAWVGIVKSEPRMQGPTWSIMVDPISAILDAELGADLEDPAQPRGINLGPASPTSFRLLCNIATGTYAGGGTWDDTRNILVTLSGFYETQADMVAEINSQIVAGMAAPPGGGAAWGDTVLWCVDDSESGGTYHFEYFTDSASPKAVTVISGHNDLVALIEPAFTGDALNLFRDAPAGPDPTLQRYNVVAGAHYWIWSPDTTNGRGQVPRGVYRESSLDSSARRFYIGGTTAISSSTTLATIDWPDAGELQYNIGSTDAASQWIEVAQIGIRSVDGLTYTPATLPEIRFGRSYGIYNQGTFGLMTDLTNNAPQYVNAGAQPMILADDWESGTDDTTWQDVYATTHPYARGRIYVSTDAVSLKEYVCPDLQLIGHFLTFSESGKLTIRPLRLPSSTEVGSYAITRANLLTDNGFPSYERGAAGIFNTLAIRDGYDAIEDKYTASPIIVRDVTSYGRQPIARTVGIELKSKRGYWPVTIADAVSLADQVLGIYGNPYAYITCDVPLTALTTALLGSAVSINTTLLPGGGGTRGVTDLMGLVTSREIDLYAGRITLTVLCTTRLVGGYAPGAKITSQTYDAIGDTWAITLDSSYFPAGTTAEDYLVAEDHMVIEYFDSETATVNLIAIVLSVAGNVVTVELPLGTWTPSTDEWILTPRIGSTTSDNLARYVYIGGSDARLRFPDRPTFTFNPG